DEQAADQDEQQPVGPEGGRDEGSVVQSVRTHVTAPKPRRSGGPRIPVSARLASGTYLMASVVTSKLTVVMPPPWGSTIAMPRLKSSATMRPAGCLFLMPFRSMVVSTS